MATTKRWLGGLLIAALACVLCGCGGGGPRTDEKTPTPAGGGKSGGAPGKKLKLAFVTNNASDFWTIAKKGTEKAEQDLGDVTVAFRIPGEGSGAKQQEILEDLVAKGTDGIAISPVDPKNETPMLNQVAKKTLLITHDSDAADSDRACYVGTDNFAAGKQAGELIKAVLPEGGKIMVFVGTLDAQNASDRYNGIKECLKGSKVEILDVRTDNADASKAKGNAVDTLIAHPEVVCLVGLWSYNGPAILGAVKDQGKLGKVKIVCFDEQSETLQGVRDGHIFGTVVQQPYEFGYQAITLMEKYLKGDKSVIPANKLKIIDTLAIKKETVDEFEAKLKKLRGQ